MSNNSHWHDCEALQSGNTQKGKKIWYSIIFFVAIDDGE